MSTNTSGQPVGVRSDMKKSEEKKTTGFPRRTERVFALRKELVYHDPRQWDKDIKTGAGDE